MRATILLLTSAFILSVLTACSGTMRPMHTEPATHGTVSKSYHSLKQLPEPEEKIVAAVYRFRDQTGQYKPSDRVASWSTAVTQGATSILMKAMEESGWFVPIERESISNLLNERQIIQNIRQQHSGGQAPQPLPPLLFAGVMLEGGIVGYDTNVITGGLGARYLGTGGSGQYRKDQVTIYLRAVSTQSGRVLKTVHTTKSIVSQQLDSGLFRFIDTNRLLEAETGYTYNEPPVMAVTEAIDDALKQLILEGIEEQVWTARDYDEVLAYREQFNYEKKKEEQLKRDYFGMIDRPELRGGWSFGTNASIGSVIGNYNNPDINPGVSLQIERAINSTFSFRANGQRTRVSAPSAYSNPVNSAELLLNAYITPRYSLSPFVAAGGGAFIFDKKFDDISEQIFPFVALQAGFDYRFNNRLGMNISTSYRYLLIDGLDGVSFGKFNDQHWGVNAGVTWRPGFLN
ncbi:curli production assembly/transport component CsgG [Rhodohalobacter sp. SW132]|uniref:CsgG/HfaB family protein n=1 Tax=Rhodohalobacter sp. SW132 TaxID=2293433 RepID=UPI000E259D39|nr:CsgG/HfaB family protein [Rhodohalobacter sp. SW132]REL38403.1 curli production assembly/transport component CsgG [Rhodohalobacter sp. SW132]